MANASQQARSNPNPNPQSSPSDEQVAQQAYHIWCQEGYPDGCQDRHWQQAREQLKATDPQAVSPSRSRA